MGSNPSGTVPRFALEPEHLLALRRHRTAPARFVLGTFASLLFTGLAAAALSDRVSRVAPLP